MTMRATVPQPKMIAAQNAVLVVAERKNSRLNRCNDKKNDLDGRTETMLFEQQVSTKQPLTKLLSRHFQLA